MRLPRPAAEQRQFTVALTAAVILCGLFAVVLGSSLPSQFRQSVSAFGLILGGLAIVVSGLRAATRNTGARRRTWLLLASAAGIALLGNLWATAVGADPVKSPSSVGEASLAIAYVLSIIGLVGLTPVRQRGAELVLLALDGIVVGCAVLVVVSITVYSQILESAEGSFAARAVSLAFPLFDVALATVALLLIVRSRADRVFFTMVGAGFLLYAAADLAFAVKAADGTFVFGTPLDLGWIWGYLILAASAWYPTRAPRELSASGSSDVQGTLLVFGLLLGAVAVQALSSHSAALTETQMVLWVLLVLAAGIRQTLLTADNAALRHGLEQRVEEQTADLRRMARETETLLTSVGDGIYGVDPSGHITFVNPPGAVALGHSADSLLGRNAHEIFHGPQPDGSAYPEAGCYITEAIEEGRVSSAEEDTYVRADGTTFPVEITASPLIDDDRIRGAVVVFRDVTQRHEVDRMKNEFLSVVSHELRTPLTSIRGSLGLLASGSLVELTPQAQRIVSIAEDSSERLTRLINDILDIERIESGKLPMTLVAHDVGTLLEAAATGVTGLAAAHAVRIEVLPSPGRVVADPDRIVQTLTNLLGNAIKYSPPDGVVQVGAERIRGEFVFGVRDEGRGIPQDKLWKVFEPFEQVDSSDARDKGGTGLGLAISRGIVERHGGRMWAESRVGEGTTVRFTLPSAPDVRPVGPGTDSPVVLVCHEERDVADGYCAMLHERGYRTLTAAVSDAMGRTKLSRPAAVVVDLEVEGTAAMLESLDSDQRTRDIPVVVVEHPLDVRDLGDAVAAAVQARKAAANVLLVEDDGDLAGLLSTLLGSHGLDVVQVTGVADAVARGRQLDPRVVVLDLELPDGDGTEVIAALRREGRLADSAVVVYTSADSFIDRPHPDDLGEVVFLTKTRVTPEQLEDTVLRLLEGRSSMSESQSADVAPEDQLGEVREQEREEVSGGAGALS